MNTNDPNSTATSDAQQSMFDNSEPAAEQPANPRPLAKAKVRSGSPMSPQLPVTAVERPIWEVRLPFLGPPPLILGEDPNDYYELRAHLYASLKPCDTTEDIWVWEGTDLIWEKLRYRRQKANIQNWAASEELEVVLYSLLGDDDSAEELARKWRKGVAGAVKKVEGLLAAARLSWDDVVARAMSRWHDRVEVLDQKITAKKAAFDDLLCGIDEHRATFGQRLRRSAQQVEDVDYHHVAPGIADA